jgi:type VI secretion system protein ImpE
MDAEQALKDGDLDTALKQLQSQIRKAPADAKLRVFLFQLLSVLGEWKKALNQLNVAAELDAGTLAMAGTYRPALQSAVLRERVFAGERDPIVFGEPQRWIALLFQALRLGGQGKAEESQGLRSAAFDKAPATAGQIDGEPFAWIADADMRLGPILEMVLNGRYNWVPFQHIRRIRFEEPSDLRDLVWVPAQITWTNGGESVALVPTRYPGSEFSEDPSIRLARRTDWLERGSGLFVGLGQRMLATDQGEYPLLGVREISLQQTDLPADGTDDG